MSEEGKDSPSWWLVDRRAARAADRHARRLERADQRAEKRSEKRSEKQAARGGAGGEAPRAPLTTERISDAAIAIIDELGVDGLTVRGLAQTLGVGTMTLYWYVENKDEVLDLVGDRLLANVAVPPSSDDWRQTAMALGSAVRAALLRHPRAVPVIVSRGSFGPNGLSLLESSIGMLRTAGFSADDATDAYFTISNYVTGTCVFETSGVNAAGDLAFDRDAYVAQASRYVSMLPADAFPNIRAAAPRLFGGDREARFRFGLGCLVDGLAARLATAPAPPSA
jgi:AcrR family transcriptional regulator